MRPGLLKSDRFWKWVLWCGVGIFFLTRIAVLMSFPIFNDEAIYLQYSQLIHSDFGKYKLISAGGNVYRDWKPPLQYWVGSAFMSLAQDPLLAGRLASFFISVLGLLGLYLFIKELFGRKEAYLAVLLYALCPPALFFNVQFVAETFVFSLAPWLYWSFLRAIGSGKLRFWYVLAAAVFGGSLLLSKQSGMVYLLLSMLLPLAFLDPQAHRHKALKDYDWRGFLARAGLVAGGILAALIVRRMGLSSEAVQLEAQFNGRWLMSVGEILRFPWSVWHSNWILVRDYYFSYYSLFIVLPLLYSLFAAWRRRSLKAAAMALGFAGGSVAVLFLLRGFNEYIYNTAVIVFLVPLLAYSFSAATEVFLEPGEKGQAARSRRVAAALVLLSFLGLLVHWAYQDVLMKVSPGDYLRRSTRWAIGNYLDNWSGGFGVMEAIKYVESQKSPVLVLADPQWGNPRTAMEVYAFGSNKIQVKGLTADFQTPQGTAAAKEYISKFPFATRLAVFSGFTDDIRKTWQENVEKGLCDARKEIQVDPDQPPLVICSF